MDNSKCKLTNFTIATIIKGYTGCDSKTAYLVSDTILKAINSLGLELIEKKEISKGE
jgi:predicted amino acid dehydrogenase